MQALAAAGLTPIGDDPPSGDRQARKATATVIAKQAPASL
jgi:hypothetical protein